MDEEIEGVVPSVYDDKDGIIIVFDMNNGLGIQLYLTDEGAQEMIDVIQNKLNARIK